MLQKERETDKGVIPHRLLDEALLGFRQGHRQPSKPQLAQAVSALKVHWPQGHLSLHAPVQAALWYPGPLWRLGCTSIPSCFNQLTNRSASPFFVLILNYNQVSINPKKFPRIQKLPCSSKIYYTWHLRTKFYLSMGMAPYSSHPISLLGRWISSGVFSGFLSRSLFDCSGTGHYCSLSLPAPNMQPVQREEAQAGPWPGCLELVHILLSAASSPEGAWLTLCCCFSDTFRVFSFYMFLVYSITFQYLYALQSDHPPKPSYSPSKK